MGELESSMGEYGDEHTHTKALCYAVFGSKTYNFMLHIL